MLSELSYQTVSPGVLEDWNVLVCLRYAFVTLTAVSPLNVGERFEDLETAPISE